MSNIFKNWLLIEELADILACTALLIEEDLSNSPDALSEPPKDTIDGKLIRRAKTGDQDAIGELYHRWMPKVTKWAEYRGYRGDNADEIAQQVMIKMLEKLPEIEDPNTFPGWIKKVAMRSMASFGHGLSRGKQRMQDYVASRGAGFNRDVRKERAARRKAALSAEEPITSGDDGDESPDERETQQSFIPGLRDEGDVPTRGRSSFSRNATFGLSKEPNPLEDLLGPEYEHSPEIMNQLRQALVDLEQQYPFRHELLTQYIMHGIPAQVIAAKFGRSPQTAKRDMQLAKDFIRDKLGMAKQHYVKTKTTDSGQQTVLPQNAPTYV